MRKQRLVSILIFSLLVSNCVPAYATDIGNIEVQTSTVGETTSETQSVSPVTNDEPENVSTPEQREEETKPSFFNVITSTCNSIVQYIKSIGTGLDDSVEFENKTTSSSTKKTGLQSNDASATTLGAHPGYTYYQVHSSQKESKFVFGEEYREFVNHDPHPGEVAITPEPTAQGASAESLGIANLGALKTTTLYSADPKDLTDNYVEPNSFTLADDGAIGPCAPVKHGYTMENLKSKVKGKAINSVYSYTLTMTKASTSYLITKHANGGEFVDIDGKTYDTAYSDSLHMVGYYGEIPIRAGYTFMGWSTDADKTATQKLSPIISYSGDTEIYAIWQEKVVTNTDITFEAKPGFIKDTTRTSITISVPEGQTIGSVGVPVVVHNGEEYTLWSEQKYGEAKDISSVVPTFNKTYYSEIFDDKDYISVVFDANKAGAQFPDGKTTYTTSVVAGTHVKAPDNPTCSGFTFLGWGTSPDATTPVDMSSQEFDNDVTYYGIWEINGNGQKTTIALHLMGGVVDGSAGDISYEAVVGNPISVIPYIPTKELWKFVGWNTDPNASTALPSSTIVTLGMELYAIYATTANDPITVTFHANGGLFVQTGRETVSTNKGSSGTYTYGSKLTTTPSPVKTGYSMMGWSPDPTDSTGYDVVGTILTEDITFYAIWKSTMEEEHTVTFIAGDSKGGSKFSNGSYSKIETVETGRMAPVPEIPKETKKLTFNYWSKTKAADWYYSTSNGSKGQPEQYIFSSPVLEDITLYAIYKEADNSSKFRRVTFDYNGGKLKGYSSVSVDVAVGTPVSKPETPKREGYTFKDWYVTKEAKSEDKWNFNDPVNKDMTLYAIWNGGSSSSSSSSTTSSSSSTFNSSSSSMATTAEIANLKAQLDAQSKALGLSSDGTYLNAAQRGLTSKDVVEVYDDGSYLASDGNVYSASGNYLHPGQVPKTGVDSTMTLILWILSLSGFVVIILSSKRFKHEK